MESTPPLERPAPADATAAVDGNTASQFTLRIKELPSALSSDAVTSLLSHYGASRVRVLKRKKPGAVLPAMGSEKFVSQVAIAEFPTRQRQLDAQQRLARVQLAGKKLVVEEIQSASQDSTAPAATANTEKPLSDAGGEQAQAKGPPADAGSAAPAPHSRTARRANRHDAPSPLAPHLGLHYAPSPLLAYKYPKASVPVVRNIANALMALPRFYTQVLHLMNKMNLPTPFEPGALPGVFSDEFMVDTRQQQSQQLRSSAARDTNSVVEEEDDESESEEETAATNGDPTQRQMKRPRTDPPVHSTGITTPTSPRSSKKRSRGVSHSQTAAAFDDSDKLRRLAALKPPRPGVVSAAELDRQRLSSAELSRDPAFVGFAQGNLSSQVHVGNLAESVDSKDLEYVFGHVLPPDASLESLAIDLQPNTASAVVSFPSRECAERATRLLHGVVLGGRPLLVRYHHTQALAVPELSPPEPLAPLPPSGESRNDISTTPWERMDPTQLALEKAMKNYSRGEPTQALYIKNLAKAVDEPTLRALAREFVPASMSLESLSIRHFTEGRMKNQAFIEFPSADTASAVLEQIHGLVLHGKPLVVSFRKAPTPTPTPAPS